MGFLFNSFAQQEVLWYKITEKIDHSTDYRSQVTTEMYYKITITSKGAMVVSEIKNAKDMKKEGRFYTNRGYKNNMYTYCREYSSASEFLNSVGSYAPAPSIDAMEMIYISSDRSKVNILLGIYGSVAGVNPGTYTINYDFSNASPKYTYIGVKCSEPTHLSNGSNYQMY